MKYDMRDRVVLLFLLVFIFSFVVVVGEEVDDKKFQEELNKFDGTLSDSLVGGDLTFAQREEIFTKLAGFDEARRDKFFAQWKDFSAVQKKGFWKDLSEAGMKSFMESYGKNYGNVEFKGADQKMLFTDKSFGNGELYFDPEKLKEFNDGNKNPWIKFEKTKDGDNNVYTMTKKDGNSVQIKVKDGDPGYKFDPKTGEFRRLVLNDKGELAFDSKSSFKWDHQGSMSVELTADGKQKFNLDFNRDLNVLRRNVEGKYTGASLKFGDGKELSTFNKYKQDKLGNFIYDKETKTYGADRKDGTFELNEDGSMSSIKNLLLNDLNKKIEGEFGQDVNYLFFDSIEDKDNAKNEVGAFNPIKEGAIVVSRDDLGKSVLSVDAPRDSLIDRSKFVAGMSDLSSDMEKTAARLKNIDPKDEASIARIKNEAKAKIGAALGGIDASKLPDWVVGETGLKTLSSLSSLGSKGAVVTDQFINSIEKSLSLSGSGIITVKGNFDEVVLNGVGAEVVNGDIRFRGNTFGGVSLDRTMFATGDLKPDYSIGSVKSDLGKNSFTVDTNKNGLGIITRVGSNLVKFGGISFRDVISGDEAFSGAFNNVGRGGLISRIAGNVAARNLGGATLDVGEYTFSVEKSAQKDLLEAAKSGNDKRFYALLGATDYELSVKLDNWPYKGGFHPEDINSGIVSGRNEQIGGAMSGLSAMVDFKKDGPKLNVENSKVFMADILSQTLRAGVSSEQFDTVNNFLGQGYSRDSIRDLAVSEMGKAVDFVGESGKNGLTSIGYSGGSGSYALFVDGKVHYIKPEIGALLHSVMPRVLDGLYLKKGSGNGNVVYDNSVKRLTGPGQKVIYDTRGSAGKIITDPKYVPSLGGSVRSR